MTNITGNANTLADAGTASGIQIGGIGRRGDKLRIIGGNEVLVRRNKLKRQLEAAIKSAEKPCAGDPVELVLQVLEDFRLQELEFDKEFDPALKFVAVMGETHCKLFADLLDKLHPHFVAGVKSSSREAIEKALYEIQPYSECAASQLFLRSALEQLVEMPMPACGGHTIERADLGPGPCTDSSNNSVTSTEANVIGAMQILTDSLISEGDDQFGTVKDALRSQLYERKPKLFLEQVQPLIVEFVRDVRRKHGDLLLELKKMPPHERRQNNAALQRIKKLIGCQKRLYDIMKIHLFTTFSEEPVLREPGKGGKQDGQPVSIGPEPFLSTLRSDLLMSYIEDGTLTYAPLSGYWIIEVPNGENPIQYDLNLVQKGANFSGTSGLAGIRSVSGSVSGYSVSFQQIGDDRIYDCTCQLSPDMRRLVSGHWSLQGGTMRDTGTFTGVFWGPKTYADAKGAEWDESAEFIVALNQIHENKHAIDHEMCASLPMLVCAIEDPDSLVTGLRDSAPAGLTVKASSSREVGDLEKARYAAQFALVDPCVIQSVCRGLLQSFKERASSALGALEEKEFFALLLLLCAAQVLTSAGAIAHASQQGDRDPNRRLCKRPGLQDLAKGVPSQADLEAFGLNCGVLAGLLWMHAQRNLDKILESTPHGATHSQLLLQECLNTAKNCHVEAEEAVHSGTSPALAVIRMMLNFLVNKSLVISQTSSHQYRFIEECLEVAAAYYAEVTNPMSENGLDCLQQQAVDMIVSSGLTLKEFFHAGIRQPVVDHLISLAKQDAWAHRKTMELLQLYRIPNFASAREEITSLRELLEHGKQVDKHFDWSKSLGKAYNSIMESHPFEKGGPFEPGAKSYLIGIYLNSELGQRFPPDTLNSPPLLPSVPAETTPSMAPSMEPMPLELLPQAARERSRSRDREQALPPIPLLPPAAIELEAKGSEAAPRQSIPVSSNSFTAAKRKLQLPDAVMTVDVSDNVRDFCALRSSEGLTPLSEPSTPPVGPTFRRSEKRNVSAVEAAAEAAQYLVGSFQGSHHLAYAIACLVCTLVPSKDLPAGATCGRTLLRKLMQKSMVTSFKVLNAEGLMRRKKEQKWYLRLVSCDDWRHVIYELLADRNRGHFNFFLKAQLQMVSTSVSKDEFLSNICCVNNFSIFHDLFKDAFFNFFYVLAQAGSRNASNELVMGPAVRELHKICTYSEFTWMYSQAVLHRLIRIRPRERHLLRFLVKSIADVPTENLERFVSRFSPLPKFPTLFNVVMEVFSIRRRGDEVRIRSEHVSKLCSLIEDLVDWKKLCLTAKLAASQMVISEDQDQADDATQAASSDGARDFGDSPMHSDMEDWEAEQSSRSSGARGRRAKKEDALGPSPRRTRTELTKHNSNVSDPSKDKDSMHDASIFHMRAVSSADASSAVGNMASAPQSHVVDAAGALEAMRRSSIMPDLLCQFVDPKVVLSEQQCSCHVRLLAILTVDGFLKEEADPETQDLPSVVAKAKAAMQELTRIYKVTHSPLNNWARQALVLLHLQCSSVASMAGLLWVGQVLLNKTIAPRMILARITAVGVGILLALLRGAYTQHWHQAKPVLGVLHQMLELAAQKEDLDAEESKSPHDSDGEDDKFANKHRMTGHELEILCHDIERLTAAELVYMTCCTGASMPVMEFLHDKASTLNSAVLRHFTSKLLAVAGRAPAQGQFFEDVPGAPMTQRMAWALTRLFVQSEVKKVVIHAEMTKALRNFIDLCRQSIKKPLSSSLDVLKQRYQETQDAIKVLETEVEAIEDKTPSDRLPVSSPASAPLSVSMSETPGAGSQSMISTELIDYFQISRPVMPMPKPKKKASGRGPSKRKAKSKKRRLSCSSDSCSERSDCEDDDAIEPDDDFNMDRNDDSEGEETFDFLKDAMQNAVDTNPHEATKACPAAAVTETVSQAQTAPKLVKLRRPNSRLKARVEPVHTGRIAPGTGGSDRLETASGQALGTPQSGPCTAAAVANVLFGTGGADSVGASPASTPGKVFSLPSPAYDMRLAGAPSPAILAELPASNQGASRISAGPPAKRRITVKGSAKSQTPAYRQG